LSNTDTHERYYLELAAAFVRGKLGGGEQQSADLWLKPLNELSVGEQEQLYQLGLRSGVRMHKFKRTMALARVQRVFGILKELQPESLLDIGSGRGAFLWPLLTEFPDLAITAIDQRQDRVNDILAVRKGGVDRLQAHAMDGCHLRFAHQTFDVVTLLEVLEHISEAQKAVDEAVRVARRCVIISVPSKAGDNPEHIHLLSKERLHSMLAAAGARVSFETVLNHIIAVSMIRHD
jgi:2-polyprenyl-3-methyl-5-hydroxy-6-metoxy-1,4-benzoquinol methylase